jgi:hypothetical protein
MVKCDFKPDISTFAKNTEAASVAGVSPEQVTYNNSTPVKLYDQIWNQHCTTYGGSNKKKRGGGTLVQTNNGGQADATNNKLMVIAANQKSQAQYDSQAMSGGKSKKNKSKKNKSKKNKSKKNKSKKNKSKKNKSKKNK